MAYGPSMAAALSGATVSQLRHWRSRRTGPLLSPEISAFPRVLYSFRDVLALRTCASLRSVSSLQGIRKAIGNLRSLGEIEHLAAYRLVSDANGNIQLVAGPEEVLDLRRRPGQYQVVAVMGDVIKPFPIRAGVVIPDLLRPRPRIAVDPEMQAGFPVIAGTRVPYDAVAALVRDGVPAEEVSTFYPGVSAEAAGDALEFARYVDSYVPPSRAA